MNWFFCFAKLLLVCMRDIAIQLLVFDGRLFQQENNQTLAAFMGSWVLPSGITKVTEIDSVLTQKVETSWTKVVLHYT